MTTPTDDLTQRATELADWFASGKGHVGDVLGWEMETANLIRELVEDRERLRAAARAELGKQAASYLEKLEDSILSSSFTPKEPTDG